MKNPELSRLAARLFDEYEVPADRSLKWAMEIETTDSEKDLSPELREFLKKPYYTDSKSEKPESFFGERMNDVSSVKVFIDGKWVSLDKIK